MAVLQFDAGTNSKPDIYLVSSILFDSKVANVNSKDYLTVSEVCVS